MAAGGLPPVDVDPHRILQVLANVLGNAVHFTPAGGSIRLAAGVTGGAVRIDVTDTGPGVTEDALAHVFERFWRGDRHGPAGGGAGLGLAIARWLVELHGGSIAAANVPGGGLRVYFTSPTSAMSRSGGAATP